MILYDTDVQFILGNSDIHIQYTSFY